MEQFSPIMNEEYSDYRHIPNETESMAGSGLFVGTSGGVINVIASSPHDTVSSAITLTINDAKWLADQLQYAVTQSN